MSGATPRGETIRDFILKEVDDHPSDIAKVTAERFQISRQAVAKHLGKLVDEELLIQEGQTRSVRYQLRPLVIDSQTYSITADLVG